MEKLFLGVSKEIITPKIGCQLYGYNPNIFSTTVHDDLTATAFWFKQGDKQALMISLTLCSITNAVYAELSEKISQKLGIDKNTIQIACTHTHTGPNIAGSEGWGEADEEYINEILIPKIHLVAEKAKNNLKAVKMATAIGESRVGINRRELSKENKIILGQNPWGPCDLQMTVISFKDEEENVVANMVHYGCHGTSAGLVSEISRDWSGIMTDALEEKTGGITAFFNGPEGDIGPRITNGKTVGNIELMRELGEKAAKDALEIFENIGEYENVELFATTKEVNIPYGPRMSREEAAATYEQFKNDKVNWGALAYEHAKRVLEAWDNNLPQDENFTFSQTIIRLGNTVFVSSPFELFTEIGLRIKGFFEDYNVMQNVNTNGIEAYFVTEDALVRGGYEIQLFVRRSTSLQSFCKDADFEYIKETVKNVNEVI